MSDRSLSSSASSYYPACVALGVELRQNAGGGGWPALAVSLFWTMITLVLRTIWVLMGGADRPSTAFALAR